MRPTLVFALALAVALLCATAASASATVVGKSTPGGCAACTILVDLVQKIAVDETPNNNVTAAFDFLCGNFRGGLAFLAGLCDALTVQLAEGVQAALDAHEIPDVTCKTGALAPLNFCPPEVAQCHLFSAPVHARPAAARAVAASSHASKQSKLAKKTEGESLLSRTARHLSASAPVSALLRATAAATATPPVGGNPAKHRPLFDTDNDAFSTAPTLRGTHWRGKDCDDLDASVYPGRALNLEGPSVDHNCNGIVGVNAAQQAYEDAFCSGSNTPRGTIVLGDSAAAHFAIPPQYIIPDNQNSSSVYQNLLPFVEDEADWPQCSWATAFANDTDCPPHKLPIHSFYQRMRERNLCNHRDYQNIGVNGGRTSNMAPPDGIISALQRTKADAPANVFYALIGNDVCSGHEDFDHMTTPAEFLTYVTQALQYMDTQLAAGSAVLFAPLVDGRVLFNTLHNHTHPAGILYSDLYDYLNCLQINPCWGWLNSNETVRNATTQHAEALSAVYPQIIATQQYNSFKMYALTVDWQEIFDKWIAAGNDPVDLIEPTDGFHPSTTGQMLTADYLWKQVSANWPELLGSVNPNNAQIKQLFGDQGGY